MANNVIDLKSPSIPLPELMEKAKVELEKDNFVLSTKMRIVKKDGRIWRFIKDFFGIVFRNIERTNHPLITTRKLKALIEKRKADLSVEKAEHEKFKTDLKIILAKVLHIDPLTNKVDEKIVKNVKKIATFQTVFSSILKQAETAPSEGLELNIKKLSNEINQLKTKNESHEKEAKEAQEHYDKSQKKLEELSKEIELLKNAQPDAAQSAKKQKRTSKKNEKKLKSLTKILNKRKETTEALKIDLEVIHAIQKKSQEELNLVETKLKKFQEDKTKLEKKEPTLDEKKIKEAEDAYKIAEEQSKKATEDAEKACKLVERLSEEVSSLKKNLTETQEDLKSSVDKIKGLQVKEAEDKLLKAKEEERKLKLRQEQAKQKEIEAKKAKEIATQNDLKKAKDLQQASEKLENEQRIESLVKKMNEEISNEGKKLTPEEIKKLNQLLQEKKLDSEKDEKFLTRLTTIALFNDEFSLLYTDKIKEDYLWNRLAHHPAPKIIAKLLESQPTWQDETKGNKYSPLPILIKSYAPDAAKHVFEILDKYSDLINLTNNEGLTSIEFAFKIGKNKLALEMFNKVTIKQDVAFKLFDFILESKDIDKSLRLEFCTEIFKKYANFPWDKYFKKWSSSNVLKENLKVVEEELLEEFNRQEANESDEYSDSDTDLDIPPTPANEGELSRVPSCSNLDTIDPKASTKSSLKKHMSSTSLPRSPSPDPENPADVSPPLSQKGSPADAEDHSSSEENELGISFLKLNETP